ncbi:Hint domain-containing protein [Roseovarius azorensis]|uniref:Hint domain-containing protein n=2 Tax=Roseovarius azorensis TaxID=1287727 RepID=A0A1H7GAE6_9RHOB|nr:Hint domain-containing protein [Roseovarius azorensis]
MWIITEGKYTQMATISLTLQNVNGDPFTSGGNINITTGTTSDAVFNETSGSVSLSTVLTNDSVTIGGFTYFYDYLGSGDVRGDPGQPAAFIRITSSEAFAPLKVGDTFAIDLAGQPGNAGYPNLQNGNTQLRVSDLDTESSVQFSGVPCFVAGTRIRMRHGTKAVEEIEVGDEVWTLDHGLQPVRWVSGVEVAALGTLAPIEFAAGSIGNTERLCVSPQHRILIEGWRAELLLGTDQVLVAACHLADAGLARRVQGGRVRYFHIRFDRHEIIDGNGVLSESLYFGRQSLSMLPQESVQELLKLFPELADGTDLELVARRVARGYEAAVLAA